ncbi:MAG: BPSS1780 family membrane protein [Lysobacteraceae bacterium]
MSIRTVPASRGVEWITNAVQLILKNPLPFLLMGLVIGVAYVIPILGSMAVAILGPALFAGVAYAGRELESGGIPDFQHLFQAFKEQDRLVKLLILCLPSIAAGMLLVVAMVVASFFALAGVGVSTAVESPAALFASMGVIGFVLLAVMLALSLVVLALTFFAIPEAMFGKLDAMPAMRESLRATLANMGAMLLYLIVMIAALFIVMLLFVAISQTLALVVALSLFTPVSSVVMYLAWKDVVASLHTSEMAAVTDDAPPPATGGFVA